jgi:hypothetical protein
MIFAKEWIRLMGLKSETEPAPSFFGISTTFAVLRIANISRVHDVPFDNIPA